MSKIDTQGMSGPVDPNYKGPVRIQPHKPWEITPRRCHTPEMVKELKILINEVLDEREGNLITLLILMLISISIMLVKKNHLINREDE